MFLLPKPWPCSSSQGCGSSEIPRNSFCPPPRLQEAFLTRGGAQGSGSTFCQGGLGGSTRPWRVLCKTGPGGAQSGGLAPGGWRPGLKLWRRVASEWLYHSYSVNPPGYSETLRERCVPTVHPRTEGHAGGAADRAFGGPHPALRHEPAQQAETGQSEASRYSRASLSCPRWFPGLRALKAALGLGLGLGLEDAPPGSRLRPTQGVSSTRLRAQAGRALCRPAWVLR